MSTPSDDARTPSSPTASATGPAATVLPSQPAGPDAAATPLPSVPGYEILGELGRGGMGAVFKVRDPELGRELAVEVLLERHRDEPRIVARFLEEAQVGGQLQHPGIVPVHEAGRLPDDRPYFTMKLVEGRTLAALLKERDTPARDLPRFLLIFQQICQTLAYAHSKGVLHRDLKPANAMVGAFGELQVMDWGLAKVMRVRGVRTVRSETAEAKSEAGSVVGTAAYMAPEQACGDVEGLDERCDVFGLGAILCEILTGSPPYRGRETGELLRKAARADLGDAFARLDGCGAEAELVQLAKTCMAAEPADRPSDAGAVSAAMTAYLAGVQERLRQAELERAAAQARAEEAQAKTRAERRARRMTVALAATLLLAVVGVGWAFWDHATHEAAQRLELAGRMAETERAVTVALTRAQQSAERANQLPCATSVEAKAVLVAWREAEAALAEAEAALTTGAAAAGVRERVADMRQRITSGQMQAQREEDLFRGLDDARLAMATTVGGNFDYSRAAAKYAEAFTHFGLPDASATSNASDDIQRKLNERIDFELVVQTTLDKVLDELLTRQGIPWTVNRAALLRAQMDMDVVQKTPLDKIDKMTHVTRATVLKWLLTKIPSDSGNSAPTYIIRPNSVEITVGGRGSPGSNASVTMFFNEEVFAHFELSDAPPTSQATEIETKLKERIDYELLVQATLDQVLDELLTRQGIPWTVNEDAFTEAMEDKDVIKKTEIDKIDKMTQVTRATVLKHLLLKMPVGDRMSVPIYLVHQKSIEITTAAAGFRAGANHPLDVSALYSDPEQTKSLARQITDEEPAVRDALVVGLDDWAFCAAEPLKSKLLAAAMLADQDPWRQDYRRAVVVGDVEALSRLSKDARRHPLPPTSLHLLAHALYENENQDEALDLLRWARGRHPDDFWIAMDLASFLKDYPSDERIGCCRVAVALRPYASAARSALGSALLDSASVISPLAGLGLGPFDMNQLDDAIAELKEAIAGDPGDSEARFNLGKALYKKWQYGDPITMQNEAVLLGPLPANALSEIDATLIHKNQALPVQGAGTVGLLASPLSQGPLLAASALFVRRTKNQLDDAIARDKNPLDDAVAEFNKAIGLDPKNALLHSNLGYALDAKEQYDEAIAEFNKAIGLDPYEARAHLDLGLTLMLKNQLDDAIAEYRKYLEFTPDISHIKADSACIAARAAARAGCWQGKDAAKTDEKERGRCRKQALDWLRVALNLWTKDVGDSKQEVRAAAANALQDCQENSDFTGVRDKDALAKLPPDEQDAWRKLWADVDALLKKAQQK